MSRPAGSGLLTRPVFGFLVVEGLVERGENVRRKVCLHVHFRAELVLTGARLGHALGPATLRVGQRALDFGRELQRRTVRALAGNHVFG